MPTKRGRDRGKSGLAWSDVWSWSADIKRQFGLDTACIISPSINPERHPFGSICVRLNLSLPRGVVEPKHVVWRHLGSDDPTEAIRLALELVSGLYMQLDRRAYEAERAALDGGALL